MCFFVFYFNTQYIDRILDTLSDSVEKIACYLFFVNQIQGFPRHLSQHVGGFVISEGPLAQLVPVENASMPDALWSLKEEKSELEFNQDVRDITNFLDYVGEPAKLIRTSLGVWVLLFLSVLLVLTVLLKKEYWKDVKYGIWRPRD